MTTPIRKGLNPNSTLQPLVRNGLQALERLHLKHVEEDLRPSFADSLDIDKAFAKGNEGTYRWDYLLGHRQTRQIIALEPHTASNKELTRVISKRKAALEQLRPHLKPGVFVADWFLVASGRVDFIPMEKATARLAQNGIRFVGTKLLRKALSKTNS